MTGFQLHNPDARAATVLSVPHAGRDYSSHVALLRGSPADWRAFEDAHVDALAATIIADGHAAIVATAARVIVDLNRHEDDLDPDMIGSAGAGRIRSVRVRAGLGLVPRRGAAGELWRLPLAPADVAGRLALYHRYHAALAQLLAGVCARVGGAVLCDLHSMPAPGGGIDAVVSDRQGTTAPPALRAATVSALRTAGLRVAINTPYAGGDIVRRHAAAGHGAIQIELARPLYLDGHGQPVAGNVAALRPIMARVAAAMGDAVASTPAILAAE